MLKRCKKNRRVIYIICASMIVIAVFFTFTKKENDSIQETRYVQSEIILPESIFLVWDMQQVSESEILMAAQEREDDTYTSTLWSLEEDMSWKRKYNIDEKIGIDERTGISNMVNILNQGEMMCTIIYPNENSIESPRIEYYWMDAQEEIRQLDIQLPDLYEYEHEHEESLSFESNMIREFQMTQKGELLGLDLNGKVHRINKETGEIEKTIPLGNDENTKVEQFISSGENVLTTSLGGVRSYQMETEGITQTREEITRVITGQTWFGNSGSTGFLLLNDKGLYEYVEGVGNPQLLFERQRMLFSDTNNMISSILRVDDKRILMAVNNVNGGNCKIFQYEERDWNHAESVVLELYALESDKRLEESVARFQVANPTIEINIRTGIVSEHGITRDDAIKQLNTSMLAGDGPDIILMDGLDIETYSDNGLLANTNEIVNISIEESDILKNVVSTFQKDNYTYAIPTRMEIPIIQANDSRLQNYDGMNTILGWLTDTKSKEEIISNNNFNQLVDMFSQMKLSLWEKDHTELTQESFFNFFDFLYQVYIEGDFKEKEFSEDEELDEGGNSFVKLNQGTHTFAISMLSNWMDVEYLYNTQRNLENMKFSFLDDNYGNTFIPRGIISINANSEYITEAKDFLEFLLSEEEQTKVPNAYEAEATGLAITEAGIIASISRQSEVDNNPNMGGYEIGSGRTGEIWTIEKLTLEEQEHFIQFVLTLDTAGSMFLPFSDVLEEQIIASAEGQVSVEVARNQAWQRIMLYNAE